MMKIALCPDDVESRGRYLGGRELPENYMGDFSLMGFVVDRYQEALSLLSSAGYLFYEQEGGIQLVVDTPDRLLEIRRLLMSHKIRCDFSDIADTLYQA